MSNLDRAQLVVPEPGKTKLLGSLTFPAWQEVIGHEFIDHDFHRIVMALLLVLGDVVIEDRFRQEVPILR